MVEKPFQLLRLKWFVHPEKIAWPHRLVRRRQLCRSIDINIPYLSSEVNDYCQSDANFPMKEPMSARS